MNNCPSNSQNLLYLSQDGHTRIEVWVEKEWAWLDRKLSAQAIAFENEGSSTERLCQGHSQTRRCT